MPTRIKINTTPAPDKEVIEVKTVWNETEANALLITRRWKLLHGGVAHADSMGFQVKPCWVLGRFDS